MRRRAATGNLSQSKANRRPLATRAENIIAWLTVAMFIVAVASAVTSFFQWRVAENALNLSADIANSSSVETMAALNISDRVATATETQARLTELALQASNRIASANERQVNAFAQDLALSQSPNVDIVLEHIEKYDFDSGFKVRFRIVNNGKYSIRGAEVYAHSEPYMLDELSHVWQSLVPVMRIDIVPGPDTAHIQPLVYAPLTEKWWKLLTSHQAAMVHAIRVRFKDFSGKSYVIDRCVDYYGEYATMGRADCAEYVQREDSVTKSDKTRGKNFAGASNR